MKNDKLSTMAIKKDLAIKVKAHCAITGKTMLDWVETALMQAMEKEKSPLLAFLKNNPQHH
jgi:tRNA(Ile)-lysidine synthase TilS/MesJ